MPSKGRPPKPVEQKRALGNPGKRALPPKAEIVALPAANGIPEPSRPLAEPGRKLWERIWTVGGFWISPNTDFEILLMTCEMADERWNLRAKVMRENEARDRRALRELDRQIVSNLSLLGLTPTDRSRLGYAEVAKQSKLELLKKMRDE